MAESTTDKITIEIVRSGKKWQVTSLQVHGHSRRVLNRWVGKFPAPPRSLLDVEVCYSAGRAVMHALEGLQPVLIDVPPV